MVRLPTELPPQHAAFDELTRQLATLGRFLQRLAPASCVVHRTDLAKHVIEDTGKS